MHLAALVESVDHVCCRYRLVAFQQAWAKAGHTLEFHLWPRTFRERLAIGKACRSADAVIVQRKLFSAWELALLRRRARRLIFDMDDAVWLRDSYSGKGFVSGKRARRFQTTMRRCDAVIAGNSYLAEHARQFCPDNTLVQIVPTCIELAHYPAPAIKPESKKTLDLVWVGSSSTLQGLERQQTLLETLGQQIPDLRLKLICDRFLKLEHLEVISCPWVAQTETAEIAKADVGISWIPDDPWSRGKCGLKVLQYMAAGLPVIANPVGVHPEMIQHGENGFLVTTESEWLEAIRILKNDSARRQIMGQNARRTVETRYSVETSSALWSQLLKQLEAKK